MPNIPAPSSHSHTMARLEGVKRSSGNGTEYWMARDIVSILGYDEWRNFEGVIERARSSMRENGLDPSHQVVSVNNRVGRA